MAYFRFLLIYIIIDVFICFINVKNLNLGNISFYLRYESHVTPPANFLNKIKPKRAGVITVLIKISDRTSSYKGLLGELN